MNNTKKNLQSGKPFRRRTPKVEKLVTDDVPTGERLCRKYRAEADAWYQLFWKLSRLRSRAESLEGELCKIYIETGFIADALSDEKTFAAKISRNKSIPKFVAASSLLKLRNERERWSLLGQRIDQLTRDLYEIDELGIAHPEKMLKACKITVGDIRRV